MLKVLCAAGSGQAVSKQHMLCILWDIYAEARTAGPVCMAMNMVVCIAQYHVVCLGATFTLVRIHVASYGP